MLKYLIPSVLLGSSLGSILSNFFIKTFKLNLFTSEIPSLSPDLALYKSFDMLDFASTIVISLIFYLLFNLLNLKFRRKKTHLPEMFLYLASVFIFWQAHFVEYSKIVLAGSFFALFLAFTLLITKLHRSVLKWDLLVFANGIILGFYLTLLVGVVGNFVSNPTFILILIPTLYFSVGQLFQRIIKSPIHLILIFAIFAPTNIAYLVLLGFIFLIAVVFSKKQNYASYVYSLLYPAFFVFLASYNPLFYLGKLDSVEEGFWLGWVQRF